MTDPRRRLPSVERLLGDPGIAAILQSAPRQVVVAAVRDLLEAARLVDGAPPETGWAQAVSDRVRATLQPSLRPVINATGVVLHTNLGRAPLPPVAIEAMQRAAVSYTNLEYDLAGGQRGSRHVHCTGLLTELTGAEGALVVNNAAGALLLAMAALGAPGDIVVSRGELVEIGGSFRIPDIIAQSGARLVEVGTTNRTHPRDYERALGRATRVLLKVHRSNFKVTGFTTEVAPSDLASLAAGRDAVTSVFDLGSGLLLDLSASGLTGEPTVAEALAASVDLVVFSGDKLLGGPQAGIVIGRSAAVAALRAHPIARAVRADKVTLAGLEATLTLYREPERARAEIPTLRMLTVPPDILAEHAQTLRAALPDVSQSRVQQGTSEVGGGSFPGTPLPTTLVTLEAGTVAPQVMAERLRTHAPPVIVRIVDNRIALDVRTIRDDEYETIARAIRYAWSAPT